MRRKTATARAGQAATTDHATMAFSRPGGEIARPAGKRPLDLDHLARQTMGDRALEQEVLAMFARQIGTIRDSIANAAPTERARLAHALKGSARGVGAFALADCAACIEDMPDDPARIARLIVLIGEVRDFIAAVSR
ncbi:MAG: Hpt domain-containing protein [Aquamicrobium sp.]|uniref:Hpt domain-containing protein n=1 Tax=Aquamicrobium sp. TaxID=1872579 RepID=UPI00349E8B6B|nr:Hpt domain-containing protein [Aquamicrobium sp.]